MITFIAHQLSFSRIMMYILEKKLCKTQADFGQSLAGPGILARAGDPVDHCENDSLFYSKLSHRNRLSFFCINNHPCPFN